MQTPDHFCISPIPPTEINRPEAQESAFLTNVPIVVQAAAAKPQTALKNMLRESSSPSVAPRPAAAASLGNFLALLILGLTPDLLNQKL